MSPDSKDPKADKEKLSASEFVRRVKEEREKREGFDYRRASLAIHGTFCARCGRDFSGANLHLLTVHHKDVNPRNNPRDGSNWENLCVFCHEAEHSRERLASQIGHGEAGRERDEDSEKMVSLADKLKNALKK